MAKYSIDKTKKLKFARFGGLSSVNQRGYDSKMPSFHSPPASRGFYCFVWPFYEIFLLGADCTKSPYVTGAKFIYLRDKSGNVINDKHPEYEALSSKEQTKYWSIETKERAAWRSKWPDYEDPEYDAKVEALEKEWEEKFSDAAKWVFVEKPTPRIFDFDGEIWHHLVATVSPGGILARKGGWVKSTVSDYRDALMKEMHLKQIEHAKYNKDCPRYSPMFVGRKRSTNYSMKDHLECFIEKL